MGPQATRAPPGRALVACGSRFHPLVFSQNFQGLLCPEKIIKKFRGIWTSFGTDFLENQKQAENSNGHLALS